MFMGSLTMGFLLEIPSKFLAPFNIIFMQGSEFRFCELQLPIVFATFRLERYALTVPLLSPLLLIAHVEKALAVSTLVGRELLIEYSLQKASNRDHAEQCRDHVCLVAEYITSFSRSLLKALVSSSNNFLAFSTWPIFPTGVPTNLLQSILWCNSWPSSSSSELGSNRGLSLGVEEACPSSCLLAVAFLFFALPLPDFPEIVQSRERDLPKQSAFLIYSYALSML